MKPLAMSVQNFKALSGPHNIRLDERGIVHVLGRNRASKAADSNGSSKTALMISAPCWCFTGRTEEKRRVIDGAQVQNRFTDGPTVVEVVFEDDSTYMLRRERSRSGNETVKLTGPHGRAWDAKHEIERRLGFDWNFFTNVVVFGPDTSARFSQAADAARKAVFDQIIPDLDRLNRIYDRADELLKQLLRDADGLDRDVQMLEARLEEIGAHDTTLLESMAFDRWSRNMGQQLALQREKLSVYEKIMTAMARSDRMKEIRPKVQEFDEVVVSLRKLEDKKVARGATIKNLIDRLKENESEAEALVAQGKCPTCHRKFDRGAKKDIVGLARFKDEATKKRLEEERRVFEALALEIADARAQHGHLEKVFQEYDRLEAADDLDMLKEDLDGIERRLGELEADERPRLQPAESRADEYSKQLAKLREEGEGVKVGTDDAQFWVTGLKQKIKTKLLDGVEEYLDERLRHYSAGLTAGEITIGFTSRTKLKKGTHQDKVAITAEHLFGAAELDLHSSGERQRIDLAIILALQDLARQQHGSAVRYSAFDEVFDHLDETGLERLMGLMAAEKEKRGTIAIVTQSPRLSAFPADHQIVVERTKEGTKVYQDGEET